MFPIVQRKGKSGEMFALSIVIIVLLSTTMVQCRYLPTRGAEEDRLFRLRQLLKDLLENDLEPTAVEHPQLLATQYDPRLYKRAVSTLPMQWDAINLYAPN